MCSIYELEENIYRKAFIGINEQEPRSVNFFKEILDDHISRASGEANVGDLNHVI